MAASELFNRYIWLVDLILAQVGLHERKSVVDGLVVHLIIIMNLKFLRGHSIAIKMLLRNSLILILYVTVQQEKFIK